MFHLLIFKLIVKKDPFFLYTEVDHFQHLALNNSTVCFSFVFFYVSSFQHFVWLCSRNVIVLYIHYAKEVNYNTKKKKRNEITRIIRRTKTKQIVQFRKKFLFNKLSGKMMGERPQKCQLIKTHLGSKKYLFRSFILVFVWFVCFLLLLLQFYLIRSMLSLVAKILSKTQSANI